MVNLHLVVGRILKSIEISQFTELDWLKQWNKQVYS